ncbi:MAG: hypothetical protein AAF449_05940 [Myxococcota bacterium]
MRHILFGVVLVALTARSSSAADRAPPIIHHKPLVEAVRNAPLIIEATIVDPSGVFAPTIFLRRVGELQYDSIQMQEKLRGETRVFVAELPPQRVANDFEYFVEAFDTEGNGPARRGTPEVPLRVRLVAAPPLSTVPPVAEVPSSSEPIITVTPTEVSPLEDDGLFGQWWFWTAIGLVAAGTAATVGLLVASGDAPVDAVIIDVRGPDPTEGQ